LIEPEPKAEGASDFEQTDLLQRDSAGGSTPALTPEFACMQYQSLIYQTGLHAWPIHKLKCQFIENFPCYTAKLSNQSVFVTVKFKLGFYSSF